FYVWEHECDIIGFGDLKRLGFIGCESIEKKLENCAQVRVPKLSMSFDVSEDFKPCVMPFRKPKPNVHDLVKKRLEEECKLGYLRKIPSKQVSNVSPIVVVPKSNGKIRICEDYTRINKFIIIPAAQDNISIKNILQFRKKDVRYLSSIDLKDAYKHPSSQLKKGELATINTPFGFYEPLRVVFGIASVPALFNNALADLIDPIPDTYRYFDDIVVISKTESGHRAALSQLFQVLEDNNIVCNCQKSQIMVNSINFLGFCISSDGTIQASNKMKGTILDSPTDSTSLRGALVKMSYARLFIPDFVKLAKSLYPKKYEKFCWTELKEKQFQHLVQAYHQAHSLHMIEDNINTLFIDVDHDNEFVGFAVSWMKGGKPFLLYSNSRVLQGSQKRYSLALRLLLAVSIAAEELESILLYNNIVVYTPSVDIKKMFDSFVSFDECISNDTTFVSLMAKLSPFQIKWEVKKKNSKSISDVPHFLIASKDAECETILDPKLIIDEYKNDYTYKVLKNQDRKKWPICLRKFKTVHEDQGLLFLDQRLFIPSTLHVERGIQSVRHGLNQHLSLAQTITKINSSIGVDKLTNCQRFEMGKAKDTSVSLHDKYTVQVTALNGNGWYKVKYDDWKECELVSKIGKSYFKIKDEETYHIRASDAVKLSTVTVTGEFKDQQLWNIHDDEVEKEPQDLLELSDAESATTAAAPLNDDNDPTNYLPDRYFVDDWIVALDAAEANIKNHTIKGWAIVATNGTQIIIQGKKVHGNTSTQKLELKAVVKGLEFLRANAKKGLLLSDSGFVCSSSQCNYDVTAFPDLWSSFQEKRGDTRIVHVSAHSKIVLNEMVDLFGKCYAAGIVDKDMEWPCDLNTAVIRSQEFIKLLNKLLKDDAADIKS
uniref:Reverse transcriptase domain-containing protein n=1 Tax=Strongyloides papillosus TaxID=174720 RepID=A0A0N5CC56_STREA